MVREDVDTRDLSQAQGFQEHRDDSVGTWFTVRLG